MHTYFIFLAASFLLSSEITQTCFKNYTKRQVIKHVLPVPSSQNTTESKLSCLLYNALYVYNIQSSHEIDDDNWARIRDSIKYDNGDLSQSYRTDYIWHLKGKCEEYARKQPQSHDNKDLLFIAKILSTKEWPYIEKFAIQAGANIIDKQAQATSHIPKKIIHLKDIRDIATFKNESNILYLQQVFKANPQEFYKELIPTLQRISRFDHLYAPISNLKPFETDDTEHKQD